MLKWHLTKNAFNLILNPSKDKEKSFDNFYTSDIHGSLINYACEAVRPAHASSSIKTEHLIFKDGFMVIDPKLEIKVNCPECIKLLKEKGF